VSLAWSFATRDRDEDSFARFHCWDGNSDAPWVEEVENYVRAWLLREAEHALAFRDDGGDFIAVAGFDPRTIFVPIVEPVAHPGWHLQVVAVRLESQRQGLSQEVFSGTFAAMREVDPGRVLYTATAHRENTASLRAAALAGLLPFRRKDEHYVELLGEVPAE
jgi:RimJ/RimL family protein N-acetyltransferase